MRSLAGIASVMTALCVLASACGSKKSNVIEPQPLAISSFSVSAPVVGADAIVASQTIELSWTGGKGPVEAVFYLDGVRMGVDPVEHTITHYVYDASPAVHQNLVTRPTPPGPSQHTATVTLTDAAGISDTAEASWPDPFQ